MPQGNTSSSGVVSVPDRFRDSWKVLHLKNHMPLLRCYAVRLIPPTGSAVTYYAVLTMSQVAGMALGVSCAAPVLGPVLGTLAVASASVAAAQVAFTLRKLCKSSTCKQAQHFLPRKHVFFYAVFGVVAFKVLGGRCRNLMPSDVVHPGALARRSVPAKGHKYAGTRSAESQVIREVYKRDGCHHCGKRAGEGIADHMPPNVLVHGRGWSKTSVNGESGAAVPPSGKSSILTENLVSHLLHGTHELKQRYFPQCVDCMKLQSISLRHGKRFLVFHFRRAFPEPPFLAGFCLGTLQLDDWEGGIDSEDNAVAGKRKK